MKKTKTTADSTGDTDIVSPSQEVDKKEKAQQARAGAGAGWWDGS